MAHSSRPRLLVLTSTFPRWADDTEPAFVLELTRRLADRFQVHVLAPHAPGAASLESLAGLTVHRFRYAPEGWQTLTYEGGILARLQARPGRLALVPLFLLAEAWAIRRLLRRHRFAAIHSHWIIPQTLALRLATLGMRNPPPAICTSHGGDLFGLQGRFLAAVKRWALRRCTGLTVVSRAMMPAARTLAPHLEPRIIPMGTDLRDTFTPAPQPPRDPHRILFVGRLVEKKGVHTLLNALARLLSRYPQLHLDLVGQGPDEAALRARSESPDLAGTVSFLGGIPHHRLPDHYRRAAVTIVPSVVAGGGDQEGFGLVLVEAMGCGCPVIVSNLPAIQDIAPDDTFALRAPPGDADALAQALEQTLQNPAQAQQRAEKALGHVRERFGWENVSKGYGVLLDRERDLLNNSSHIKKRLPHAAVNMSSRQQKAYKIERLLQLEPGNGPFRLLEVGTGSGGIAHYFATHHQLDCDVDAVDVMDQRVIQEGFSFYLLKDTDLPFPDETYDVVISNHVIEHVGQWLEQENHLSEIKRVLKPNGVAYLAVPNRWMIMEPHYKLPFLSWLPRPLRTPYLKASGKGHFYDCEPLTASRIKKLTKAANLVPTDITHRAFRETLKIEDKNSNKEIPLKWLARRSDRTLSRLTPISPTLVYLLHRH